MINRGLAGEFQWLNKRFLVAGLSGGKDSLALCLYLKNNGIRFTPVFIDTGHEHPDTYHYIHNYLSTIFTNIEVIREELYFKEDSAFKGGFEQLVDLNKEFPSVLRRSCTKHLKMRPLIRYLNKKRKETRAKPISCSGIRWQESSKRSKLSEIEDIDEATWWRPVISWTEKNIIDYINENNVKPNPLYIDGGASRVGCYPCIFASKSGIRYMSIKDPKRIEYIDDFENRINQKHKDKDNTYFFTRGVPRKPRPIREVVEWSLGGSENDTRDQELDGCLKWGLCESASVRLNIDD